MEKVNLDVIKPWITKKLIEILGFEDDVVMQYVFNMLESEKVKKKNFYTLKHAHVGKVTLETKWPTRPELNSVSVTWSSYK